MKKILSIALGLVLILGLVACGAPKDQDQTDDPGVIETPDVEDPVDEDEPLVGISVPQAPTGWVAATQWSARNTAERLGLNYRLLASENENEQANHIDELIQMNCEIIVLFPHNDTLAAAGQRVMDAGITLVNFDRTLGDVVPDYYVAGNNRQMGIIGAEYIGEKLGGEGQVVIVSIPAYGEIFAERVQGFRDTVAEKYPDIEILEEYGASNGAPETGLALMTDILTAQQQIDAVYSTDDELSIGLIQAIAEANRMDEIKAITGGGGAQAYFKVMDEYPDMAISSQTYDPYMMGTCVEIAARILDGEEVEQTTIIPARTLDKDTYQAWLDELYITEDSPY